MTLPANIARALDNYRWWVMNHALGNPVSDGSQWREPLESAIAEIAAERDRYRDALVARHGGEPLELLSELDAARAERDRAIAECKLMEHKVITCGVAAHHPDANLTRTGAYAEEWDSPQAEDVRKLRAERDAVRQELNELDIYLRCRGAQGESVLARIQRMEHDRKNVDRFWQNAQTRGDVLQQQLDQCVQEREALAKSYRETIDDRDDLLRIINDAFLSLHIPGSTKAFDGRNLVVHAQDSAEVAMVLRAERDEARRERDTALDNTSLPGYVRIVEERDAAVAKCASMEQERDHLRAYAYEVEAASWWKVGLAGHPTPADHIRSIVQERDDALARCAELERIAEQSRRDGQEIAAGLHERIAELERDLAAERADIAAAQLVLPACCGSLADAASTLKQERDELERELQRDLELMARTSLWRRLREQLDAVTAQRDELLRAAKSLTEDPNACWEDFLAAVDAIARAQPEQPQQPKEEP